MSYKIDFLHAGTYLLKLRIDDVILYGPVQACPKRLLKLSRGPFSCNLFFMVCYAIAQKETKRGAKSYASKERIAKDSKHSVLHGVRF